MYGPLWRLLPGPWPAKVLVLVLLAAIVVVLCFGWVFPAIAPHLPFNDTTVAGAWAVTGSVWAAGSAG